MRTRRRMRNTSTVVPAQAGTHNTVSLEAPHGFPPQPALECFSRGRERPYWCGCAFLYVMLATGSLSAQPYPTRPIRLIVPFPAGGTADVLARSITNETGAQLGQPFVIDNRGGANGIIGIDIVAKAPPDGHTLLHVTAAFVINPHVYLKLPYDVFRDFEPVTNAVLGTGYLVLLHPAVAANTVKELIALANDPKMSGKLSYSSPGVGNTLHLAAELFATRTGIKLLHVPYKGVAPALNAVLAGEVQMTLIPPTIAVPQIKAGRAKAIAFTGSTRFPGLPQLPTMTEAGIRISNSPARGTAGSRRQKHRRTCLRACTRKWRSRCRRRACARSSSPAVTSRTDARLRNFARFCGSNTSVMPRWCGWRMYQNRRTNTY